MATMSEIDPTKISQSEKEKLIEEMLYKGRKMSAIMKKTGFSTDEIFQIGRTRILKRIHRYLDQKLTFSEIAKQLGADSEVIRKILVSEIKTLLVETNDIKIISQQLSISPELIREILKPELYLGYIQLKSIKTMADYYPLSPRLIKRYLEEVGFSILSSGYMKKLLSHYNTGEYAYWKKITEKIRNVIYGELVGDGSIEKYGASIKGKKITELIPVKNVGLVKYKQALDYFKSNKIKSGIDDLSNEVKMFEHAVNIICNTRVTNFSLHTSESEEKWLEHIGNLFNREGMKTTLFTYQTKNKKGEEIWQCMFRTMACIQYYQLLEKWYPKGEKIAPRDFDLTPTTLLHWHVGDGTTGSKQIFLATDNFSKDDVEFLATILQKRIIIETHIYKRKDKRYPDKDYYYIAISDQRNIKKYFNYIDKADPASVKLAKKLFPHKFDLNISIKD